MTRPFVFAAEHPIVPVVTIQDAVAAESIADALLAGGVGIIEVTLRSDAALDAVGALAARGDIVVGAGTVLTEAQADAAAARGAAFVVSPGIDLAVVERAWSAGMAALPGVATPTELHTALRAGIPTVKLFPAAQLGGVDAVAALAAPFPAARFMPSGGVTPDAVARYAAHPAVFAVGCSWITPADAVAARDSSRITALAAQARASWDSARV